jgi:phosphoglycolate phosphatase
MYKHIFFDLDGTVTDPSEGIRNSYNHALKKLSLDRPSEKKFRSFIGPPLHSVFEDEYGLTGESNSQAIAYYREYFAERGLFENDVYPGLEKVLDELVGNGGYAYIVTTKPKVYATQIIEHFGLRPFFRRIFGSNLDGSMSDKTDLIRYAVKNVGIRDKNALAMVGDRHLDITGAVNNDVDGVGVTYGFGSEKELRGAGAVHIAHTPEDLADILLD